MKALISFLFFVLSFVIDDPPINRTPLIGELNAGREKIAWIIEENSLKEEISGNAYFGIINAASSWIIVYKKGKSYHAAYQNYSDSTIQRRDIPVGFDILDKLFAINENDISPFVYGTAEYSPFYCYFILYDDTHDSFLECNSNMRKIDSSGLKESVSILAEYGAGVLSSIIELSDIGIKSDN
ncbi:MAG: hypothetical protein IKR88_01940 [Bacteroidales bacterium]|nr:hypothetical protein [Bacteroidales bacterium]